MSRADLDEHLKKIDALSDEIIRHVPHHTSQAVEFRADLAGLLVVAIAASYETCVKDTLIRFASRHHDFFGEFVENNYMKLNSRINIKDLHSYAKTFGCGINNKFKEKLNLRKKKLNDRIGQDIENRYLQILSWRHDFAHGWVRNTTVEEAMITHKLAKRVLYIFDEAFNEDEDS